MKFRPTELAGVYVIEPEPVEDERGSFARIWCAQELREQGLDTRLAQMSVSRNPHRGTLRGMHFQAAPHAETRIVRCSRGSIFDVALDLRTGSPTYLQWIGLELSQESGAMLYIAPGLAHGFLSLSDDVEVVYQMSMPYRAELARGVRWDDPAFGIEWPEPPRLLSERDRSWPDFES